MTAPSPMPSSIYASQRATRSLQRLVAELVERVDSLAAELDMISAVAPSPPSMLLTVEQAADQLGISRSRVFVLIKDGGLRSVKLGASRRIPRVAVDELVETLANCQPAA